MSDYRAGKRTTWSVIGVFVVECAGKLPGFQDLTNGGWCGMVIIDFVQWQELRGRLTDFE